jgi:hypothetical protein
VSFENLTPECLPAALTAAALLFGRKDLNHRVRSLIVSHVPAFDIHSLDEAAEALTGAFRKAGVPAGAQRNIRVDTFRASLMKVDQWLRAGIFVLSREDVKAPSAWMHDLPQVFFAVGNRSVLELPAAAILNSRKPRRITPDDKWLQETKRLVQLAIAQGFAIVSSYGNTPYYVVSRLAKGSPMIVVCDDVLPSMASEKTALEFISAYHDLFRYEQTLFISSFPPGVRPNSDVRSSERDHLVAALASVILVAEVRNGGNMQQVIDIALRRTIKIIGFPPCSSDRPSLTEPTMGKAIPRASQSTETTGGIMLQPDRQTTRLRAAKSGQVRLVELYNVPTDLTWLIHYTRSRPGPWPGQTIAEYCQSLIDGQKGACHTAFDTLVHILEERLIRASSRLTRGPWGVVSFSECLPAELDTLVKWRKGLCRWSFEPYGIALPQESLAGLGAGPAIYGSREDFQHLTDALKHLFQAQHSSMGDWTAEKEWRVRGNLLLSDTMFQEMVVIVPSHDEATAVALEFGCQVALSGISGRNGVRGLSLHYPLIKKS